MPQNIDVIEFMTSNSTLSACCLCWAEPVWLTLHEEEFATGIQNTQENNKYQYRMQNRASGIAVSAMCYYSIAPEDPPAVPAGLRRAVPVRGLS